MHCAKVIGRVVASQKYETTENLKLLLIQPLDWKYKILGDPIVAADVVGSGSNEYVFWVASREAAMALGGTTLQNIPPIDAAVVGIIDQVNFREKT